MTKRRKQWQDYRVTRPSITIIGLQADVCYRGPRHACRNAILKASPTNIGYCWIEIGRAAVENECWPLQPNETIAMPITRTDQINVLFDVEDDRLFVLFDNW
ncbi:MAG: hypothetical protein A2167_05465 [Planctomycetes bacterium RBG_13_46_10]|nr:MAG: hypothetical protein A2167_05465 [Planctomycetes bacterium RBG_13_46_10]